MGKYIKKNLRGNWQEEDFAECNEGRENKQTVN
jgi:hypothetical protein